MLVPVIRVLFQINALMVIIGGSNALAEIYHDTWPIRQGIDMVAHLVR